MRGLLENGRFTLWEQLRVALLLAHRGSATPPPDWYYDHWHILTADRRDLVERMIHTAYPETLAGQFSDWRKEREAFNGSRFGLVVDFVGPDE